MKVEKIEIAKLKPLEHNVRTHTQTQIRELIRCYEQFGQTRPLVIDEDNNILIGNGFYTALKTKGETTIEVIRKTGLTETQKKKLILSDNKTFSLGADNYSEVENYINEICKEDFDIAGFDENTLKSMIRSIDEITEDVQKQGIVNIEPMPSMREEPLETDATAINTIERKPTETSKINEPIKSDVILRKSVICPNCGEVVYID